MVEDDLADVADLSPHLGLASSGSDGGGGVPIRTAVVGVILAAEQAFQLLTVECVRERVERLFLQVLVGYFGPE